MPNLERLSKQASDGNATFSIKADYKRQTVEISRSAPQLGYWASTDGKGGTDVRVPTNVIMQIQHLVLPPGVTNLVTNNINKTNNPTKGQ